MTSYNNELSLLLMIEQEDASSTEYGTTVGGVSGVIQFAASGGTDHSIISTDLGGAYVGVASDAIGCFAKCIYANHTMNQGLMRKIVAFADGGASTTLTTDEWPVAVASGDIFQFVKPPSIFVGVDTGAVATFSDADRNGKANDYWNGTTAAGGPYMECVKSTLVSETALRLVTDFVQAGGEFTAAAGANATVGDLMEVWCCPEEMTGTLFDCQVEPLKRGSTIGRYEPQADQRGMRTATANLEFAFRGPGNSTPAGRTEISRMLGSPLTEQTAGGNLTAGPGGATNSVVYAGGAAVDGHLYVTSRGDVFCCTSAATPLVPAPSLRVPEINTATITELKTFWPGDKFNHLLCAKQYRGDGIREEIYAIAPDFTFEGKLGDFLRAKVSCQGGDWYRVARDEAGAEARKWRAKKPGVAPIMMGGGRVCYGGVELALESFTLNLNQKATRKGCYGAPNHEAGWDLLRGTPTGQLVMKANSSGVVYPLWGTGSWLTEHLSAEPYSSVYPTGPEYSFLIQCGTKAGYPGVFAFWAQLVQLTNLAFSGDEGVITITADFQVLDHDTDTTGLPPWALGIG